MKFLKFVLMRSGQARRLLIGAVVAGALSGGASVALLAVVNSSLRAEAGADLRRVGLAFLGLIVVVTVARVASISLLATLGQGMVRDLRIQISRQILAAPLGRLEELGAHRLFATLTDDVNALTQALLFVPVLFINGTIVLGGFGYLAWLDVRLFGLFLVAVVVGAFSYRIPAMIGVRKFALAREEQDNLFEHFRGLTEGVKELKLHRLRRLAFVDLLYGTADLVRRLRVTAALVYGTAAAWGNLLFFVVIGVLLFVRPSFVTASRDVLVGYTLVLLYLMGPLQTLLDQVSNLGRAEVAVRKIHHLGFQLAESGSEDLGAGRFERDSAAAGGGAAAPDEAAAPWSHLSLDGVTHTYHAADEDRAFTLGPVDFTLKPGELVFLVGGNGSGKTTLAKVLVGLYAPDGGELRVDGELVAPQEVDAYRQLFSVVFGDFYLFDRLLGLEGADVDERARRYLAELQIGHKVEVKDGALSTVDLSQGQRKRLALLTAYLEDRPIYLFDEWAADQDPVFKDIFYREVLPELARRGKAVVAISHDDRYYPLAHRVVKMADGRVEYDGPADGMPRFRGD